MARLRDARPFALLLALLVIVADRITKLWVVAHVQTGHTIPVIPGIFQISHVLNTGAAFSMFEGARSPETVRLVLISVSILEAVVVFGLLLKTGRELSRMTIAFALILGGAVGNMYDRIHLRHVVDFLEVHIVHYHWPDFNVADSCIFVGACLLMIEALRPQPTLVSATHDR